MERLNDAELKAHLMETDDEFRSLVNQHCELDKRLVDLESRSHLSEQEQMEEVKLKKLKLRVKDQMEQLVVRHRDQSAGS